MGVIRSAAEIVGVLAVSALAAHVAQLVGASAVESAASAYVAAVAYAWGVVKIYERALGRGQHARAWYGVVKAK